MPDDIIPGGEGVITGGSDGEDILFRDVWVPDECPRLRESRWDAAALRLRASRSAGRGRSGAL